VAAGAIGPATAQGALAVTRTDDPPPDGCAAADCSLREAVVAANAVGGPDTVVVPPGTYTLAIPPDVSPNDGQDGDLDLLEDLTIIGAGAPLTVIDGAQIDRVVHVLSGSVDISGVTVRGGSTASNGGGLLNGGSQVTLRGVAIANNSMTGGAADGGGITNTGVGAQLSILDSTFVGNGVSTSFGGDGGALANISGASASLTNVTISGNTANQGRRSHLQLRRHADPDELHDHRQHHGPRCPHPREHRGRGDLLHKRNRLTVQHDPGGKPRRGPDPRRGPRLPGGPDVPGKQSGRLRLHQLHLHAGHRGSDQYRSEARTPGRQRGPDINPRVAR